MKRFLKVRVLLTVIMCLLCSICLDGCTSTAKVEEEGDRNNYSYFKQVRSLLKVRDLDTECEQKGKYSRFGRNYDGGYVMFDDFSKDCIAYSFGISNDVSWDLSMAEKGMDVFMYDPTIEGLPSQHDKFHFFKLGITGDNKAPDMKTMKEFIDYNGHSDKTNLILKMDVEGAEWDFLNEVSEETLNQFSQVVLELHWFSNESLHNQILSALERLNKTHQVVHIHANNHVGVDFCENIMLPQVLEITCLRKSSYNFIDSYKYFPTGLDMPNNPHVKEIVLGSW